MRNDFVTATIRYAKISQTQRNRPNTWGRTYDFYRLMDGLFNRKSMNSVLAEKNLSLRDITKGDFFRLVVICARHIEEHGRNQKYPPHFWECWISFRELLELMYLQGNCWTTERNMSTTRILLVAAIIFNLPDNCRLERILSDPKARHIEGSYWLDPEDLELLKTLPIDLDGIFQTDAEVFLGLKTNLDFFLRVCRPS